MKFGIIGLMTVFILGSTAVSFAEGGAGGGCALKADKAPVAATADAAESAAPAVNAGNTICPVMGTEVSVDSPNKVEYKGKIYNLCCSGCEATFLKDPEAAIKKLSELPAK